MMSRMNSAHFMTKQTIIFHPPPELSNMMCLNMHFAVLDVALLNLNLSSKLSYGRNMILFFPDLTIVARDKRMLLYVDIVIQSYIKMI